MAPRSNADSEDNVEFFTCDHMGLGDPQQTASTDPNLSDHALSESGAPIAQLSVDWNLVLTNLQREKKRKVAREEEQYVHRSLFCWESSSVLREWFIKVAEWDWFNRVILMLIVANCVFLVLDDPVCKCNTDTCTEAELYTRSLYATLNCDYWDDRKVVLKVAEYIFTALFTVEMIVKIVARGFFLHKHSYLRDGWNWLDFIVVVCSLISLAPGLLENVQVLRTVRVLRPLRTMTRIKGMRPLINTLLRSIKALGNVVMLLVFFLIVYGILGIELLKGGMRGRCFVDPMPGKNTIPDAALSRLLSQQTPFLAAPSVNIGGWNADITFCSVNEGGNGCPPYALDGIYFNTTCSTFKWCGTDWCTDDWNPNPFDFGGGFVSYDNIGEAFLAIFQTLTMEGWSDVLYRHQDGWHEWGARAFHSSWVLIGTFFVIQLALAVLSASFVLAEQDERTEKEKEALSKSAILKPKEILAQKLRSTNLKARISQVRVFNTVVSRFSSGGRQQTTSVTTSTSGDRFLSTRSSFAFLKQGRVAKFLGLMQEKFDWFRSYVRILVGSSIFQNFIIGAILCNTAVMSVYHHDQAWYEDSICRRRCELDFRVPADASEHCVGPLFNRSFTFDYQGGGYRPPQREYCFMENDLDFWPGEEGNSCSRHTTEVACVEAVPTNGVGCHYFGNGVCKLALYNHVTFAEEVAMLDSRSGTMSLRHFCGDGLDQCPNFRPGWNRALDQLNSVLTFVFIAEMVLKWLGLGFWDYFEDAFNRFDCVVVTFSIIEMVVESQNTGNSGSAISALRGMRLFRLFKLARSWKSMRKILHTLAVALGSLGPLTVVWVMFMYIFALLAMQFFGGKFRFVKTDAPRSNFDSFFPSNVGHGAFLVVFQIISTENWNTVMYNSMTALNATTPIASLLTITIVTFGNYIIMNLFISILLQGFGDDDDEEEDEADTAVASTTKHIGPAAKLANRFRTIFGVKPPTNRIASLASEQVTEDAAENAAKMLARRVAHQVPEILGSEYEGSDAGSDMYETEVALKGYTRHVRFPEYNSLIWLSVNSKLRIWVAFLVHHPLFDNIILLCIFITSVTLLLERPDDTIIADHCPRPPQFLNCTGLPPGQTEEINCGRDEKEPDFGRTWAPCDADEGYPPCCFIVSRVETFASMDIVFTVIFLLEMVMKIISDGLFAHRHAYLRNPWNVLDCVIVAISLFSSFGSGESLKSLKALRALRALRPLRVIKRNPGLRIAVVCLLSSIPAMFNVIVVVLVWFSMYAMLGVQLFKGSLYRCVDLDDGLFFGNAMFPTGNLYTPTPKLGGPGAVPTIIECVSAGSHTSGAGGVAVWEDKEYTFNSYPRALLTLFEMATTEGWMDVMAACVDSISVGVAPVPNQNPFWSLYCAVHIILGAFVLLNLIVGSVINNYNKIKSRNDGMTPFLTPAQEEWKETQNLVFKLKPQQRTAIPTNRVRAFCFQISTHRYFEYAVTTVILLNVVTMVLKTHDQDPCFAAVLFWVNVVFTTIFLLESIIKLVGLGFRWYFLDTWNLFDFVIVVLSIATIVLDALGKEYDCTIQDRQSLDIPALSVFRAFRIARVFRLVRRLKGLRQMIETLIISLPSLVNIGTLLLLMIVIFSVLGVTFFYNVNLDQDAYGRMGKDDNYVHLDSALWLLHRQTTGEAWNGIMYYCMESDIYRACDKRYGDYLNDGCGGFAISIIFHVLWQVFGTYVMMQLFTAVILENFHQLSQEDRTALPKEKLHEFVDVWTTLDPHAEGTIGIKSIPELIVQLSPPLGLKDKNVTSQMLMQIIKDLEIPIRDDRVRYIDTFLAFVRRVLASDVEDDTDNFMNNCDDTQEEKCVTAAQDFAARQVQNAYREWKERKLQVKKAVSVTFHIPVHGTAKAIVTS